MKNIWFLCKIRCERIAENGMHKKVTEAYLVDALSYTEAESRIIEEVTPFMTGEFKVAGIAMQNYSELFPSDKETANRWYKCKLAFSTIDEKSGAVKKSMVQMLVQASDFQDALHCLNEGMKETMADYVIVSISETPIMDVFPYQPEVKSEFEGEKR